MLQNTDACDGSSHYGDLHSGGYKAGVILAPIGPIGDLREVNLLNHRLPHRPPVIRHMFQIDHSTQQARQKTGPGSQPDKFFSEQFHFSASSAAMEPYSIRKPLSKNRSSDNPVTRSIYAAFFAAS